MTSFFRSSVTTDRDYETIGKRREHIAGTSYQFKHPTFFSILRNRPSSVLITISKDMFLCILLKVNRSFTVPVHVGAIVEVLATKLPILVIEC